MKICFAASGGGHLRQILLLSSLWDQGDCFFVSEDSILFRTFRGPARRYKVTGYAIGEIRQIYLIFNLLWRIARNIYEAFKHVYAERPDVVITTGAGSVFFFTLFARMSGAKLILIETFARSEKLSKFARLAGVFATQRILQAASLSSFWPDAPVFDPIKPVADANPAKDDLILATVGATLPFERMIQAVRHLETTGAVTSRVIYQVGRGCALPEGAIAFHEMPVEQLSSILARARIVVCHGGTGSIIPALQAGCHVIAFVRQQRLGEHYDDHQKELATVLHGRGLIQIADDAASLKKALERTKDSDAPCVKNDVSELAMFVKQKLEVWCSHDVRLDR